MTVTLSVKNVPDELAERLRSRAASNRRSLQRELLCILEAAVDERQSASLVPPAPRTLTVDALADRARELFPGGTKSSVALIRAMRDAR